MLEKEIEKKVCDYAKDKGFLVYKFVSPGRAGVPDRLFITPKGVCFFIEFKRPGGELTPLQEFEIERIRRNEGLVYVVDNVEEGKKLIEGVRK